MHLQTEWWHKCPPCLFQVLLIPIRVLASESSGGFIEQKEFWWTQISDTVRNSQENLQIDVHAARTVRSSALFPWRIHSWLHNMYFMQGLSCEQYRGKTSGEIHKQESTMHNIKCMKIHSWITVERLHRWNRMSCIEMFFLYDLILSMLWHPLNDGLLVLRFAGPGRRGPFRHNSRAQARSITSACMITILKLIWKHSLSYLNADALVTIC